ncbi:MAG: S-methyl-5-thioribose-1-phosphate isomerase [Saprospiraceae bacterium]|nr:S-methyl-5-thioribose-1-phosphate isomerase [Saprospiraceae bacterium]
MKINHLHYRSIWLQSDALVQIFDQCRFPHEIELMDLRSMEDCARAIRDMHVRGAPLIGATAAWGMYFAVREAPEGVEFEAHIRQAAEYLNATRPTAVDLFRALRLMQEQLANAGGKENKIVQARQTAQFIADESAEQCRMIGEHGLPLIEAISAAKAGNPVNILTHCNAGWLACVDYGTATAPIYAAFDKGIPVHVWVDETRPLNQGARLTAFELQQHGVPHTVITDNAGGHLMQHGLVDLVITGTDRTTRCGDVANKIGTYLKALAAKDNAVPFYVALPSSTIDWSMRDGVAEIPIEERSATEVQYIQGWKNGKIEQVLLTPPGSPAANYGFDVTPARLITGLVTERGICEASEAGLTALFPEI